MPTQTDHKQRNIVKLDPKVENKELEKLLVLLKKSPAELNNSLGDEQENESKSSGKSQRLQQGGESSQDEPEVNCLQQFSEMYQNERQLSSHPQHTSLSHIFTTLVKTRLNNQTWMKSAPGSHLYHLLVCLNIYLRDPVYQRQFADMEGVQALAQHLEKQASSYLGHGDFTCLVILKKTANIIQKLASAEHLRSVLVSAGIHRSLVLLLNGGDIDVLHSTFYALTHMVQHSSSTEARSQLAQLSCIEILLRILQDYDIMSKKLAADLLRYLVIDNKARELVKMYDGIPILLSQLHSNSPRLLRRVVWCLTYLCKDEESSNDIRLLGGIPLLLKLLHDKKLISERTITENGGTARKVSAEEEIRNLKRMTSYEQTTEKEEELREYSLKLRVAVCTCLTELVVSDTNAQHVVQSNGIYYLALLLLPGDSSQSVDLQANAFRALRFLFSLERNRRLFKTIFPVGLFEKFIDVGHYKRDMKCYEPLVKKMRDLKEDALEVMSDNIHSLNQLREASHYIGEYGVLEHLGTGAFGSVSKVRKRNAGNSYLALKEININQTVFGKNKSECVQAAGDIMTELNVIKEQLKHPNVVKYKETFPKNDKLYIVMELIEGAPLSDHFHSLKEKGQRFSEERIWKIFIQITLALRYLHKDKHIVHRDLTPNNIMLGENDKVTITDFGAAKLKPKDCSRMKTIVGTIVYSSPEVIQNQPYNDKVDVWAAGCILYEMCTLVPPFFSKNIMALVKMIVAGNYEEIAEDYSPLLRSTIDKCVTVEPSQRPDIVEVAGHISERVLLHMDAQGREQIALEKKLEKERRKTQKYFRETAENREKYHKLCVITTERYEKIVNLESSGGGASIKDCQSDSGGGGPSSLDSVGVFSDTELPPLRYHIKVPCSGHHPHHHHHHLSEGLSSDDSSTYSPLVQNRPHWFQSDEDSLSSGSESREGSAGLRRRMPPMPPTRPPTGQDGNQLRRRTTKTVDSNQPADTNQILHVDVGFTSRDSGIISDEPSPNGSGVEQSSAVSNGRGRGQISRSMSTPTITGQRLNKQRTKTGAKVSKLTIAPDRVRQISDPIQDMLHQLHKIIYICQLPPTLSHDPKRRVIERFKRALFAPPPQSSSVDLKSELHKLVTMCREQIELNLGHGDSQNLTKLVSLEHSGGSRGAGYGVYDTDAEEGGVTYERMHAMIETVLQESGYYKANQSSAQRPGLRQVASTNGLDHFGLQAMLE